MLDTGILLFGNSGAGINSDLDSYHGQIIDINDTIMKLQSLPKYTNCGGAMTLCNSFAKPGDT